jgi:hypothetical protein
MNISIRKDGDGYLAKVKGQDNLFVFAYSKQDAVIELKNVVEMMLDYHLEQANNERIIKNELTHEVEKYAIQV